jgi:chromosome segregation ATPase
MDAETQKFFELLYATVQNGFERLEARIGRVEQRLAHIEERLDRLEARVAHIEERLDRLEARVARVGERLDRLEARVARVEERLDRVEARLAEVEERLDRVEARLDRLEARVDGMDVKYTESFLGVYDRFRSLETRLDHVQGAIADLREQVGHFGARLAVAVERLEKVEEAIDQLNVRVDGLAEDMRQRFRYVNERLAELRPA